MANLRMKELEYVVRKDIHKFCKPIEDLKDICPECRKKKAYRQKGTEIENFSIIPIKNVVSFKKPMW